MPKIIFIDPQSYHNLSHYDKGMLTSMEASDVVLFGNTLWDCDKPNADLRLWFTYSNYKKSVLKGISYVFTLLRIICYILRHSEIRIAHIQWLRLWKADYLFARWLKNRGIKIIYTAHNILPHDSGDRYRDNYAKYYQLVDTICVHSGSTKKDLISQFGLAADKIEVIPHGLIESDVPEEIVISRSKHLRDKYNIDSKCFIISSLGLQSYYKGVDNLIKVWSSIETLKTDSSLKLLIVGRNGGLDYSSIENLSNVLIVEGRVSNEDFQAFLEMSDIVLLPYRMISQSGVLFSAITRNKPVLVSDVGGLPEPLSIGNIGINIGKPTEENLKEALISITADREIIKQMNSSKQEFDKVKSYYSWGQISQKLKRLYKTLLSRS